MTELKVEVPKAPEVAKTPEVTREPFKQKSPAYWNITQDGKKVIATSNLGDKFEGTMIEFNKLLRA